MSNQAIAGGEENGHVPQVGSPSSQHFMAVNQESPLLDWDRRHGSLSSAMSEIRGSPVAVMSSSAAHNASPVSYLNVEDAACVHVSQPGVYRSEDVACDDPRTPMAASPPTAVNPLSLAASSIPLVATDATLTNLVSKTSSTSVVGIHGSSAAPVTTPLKEEKGMGTGSVTTPKIPVLPLAASTAGASSVPIFSEQPLGGLSSPNLSGARAKIASHETTTDSTKDRFTTYKVDIEMNEKGSLNVISVFHRYSEFRDLFEILNKKYPKKLDKVKFPGKRLLGNFDPKVIHERQCALQQFMQIVLSVAEMNSDIAVVGFVTPRHRGHQRHQSDGTDLLRDERESSSEVVAPAGVKVIKPDDERTMNSGGWDLGDGENSKASVKDFLMMKIIGKGSFGKVLLCKQNNSKKFFAIKVLSKDLIIKQHEIKHIMSERNVLLGNKGHPFLVSLQYSFQTPTKLYFVLDYAMGGELFFHLQREKRFSIPRSLFYAAEITSALGFLHSRDIVYRDLKPENILFTVGGHIIITDFGLCKENVPRGGTTMTFCGTPEYLAPEVLLRRPYGRAVDWWCLGCVTYEMMCGLPPFYSRHCEEMYERILHDTLRFPDHVPADARSFLEGLLNKDPALRLGSSPLDCEAVKSHLFFESLDWAKLDRLEVAPLWLPEVSDDTDLRNFDPTFVNEPVPNSVVAGGCDTDGHSMRLVGLVEAAPNRDPNPFTGFSFVGSNALVQKQD